MLTGVNILIAEDNKLNQKIANYILQKQNANITMVSNGIEAIEHMKKGNFDIVLMDIYMPLMDGYAATRSIRTDLKSNIPIIALTASITADDNGECYKAGMNACISKPFNPENLCALILKLINERK